MKKYYNITAPRLTDYQFNDVEKIDIAPNLLLLHHYDPLSPTTNADIYFWGSGGSFENKTTFGGGFHLLEHLVATQITKATKRYNKHGTKTNAATSYQTTAYDLLSLKHNFVDSFKLLSDTLCSAKILPKILKDQRKIIYQEGQSMTAELNPDDKILLGMFNKNPELALPLIGALDDDYIRRVKAFDPEFKLSHLNCVKDIEIDALEKHYQAYNIQPCYVYIKGNITPEAAAELVTKSALNNGQRQEPKVISFTSEAPVILLEKYRNESMIGLQFQPKISTNQDTVTSQVIANAVQKKLYKIIREEEKLAYAVQAKLEYLVGWDPQLRIMVDTTEKNKVLEKIMAFVDNHSAFVTPKDIEEQKIATLAGIFSSTRASSSSTLVRNLVKFNNLSNSKFLLDHVSNIDSKAVCRHDIPNLLEQTPSVFLSVYGRNEDPLDANHAVATFQNKYNLNPF